MVNMWSVCLFLSISVFVVLILLGILRFIYRTIKKKIRRPTLLATWFIGVAFASAAILIYPVCRESVNGAIIPSILNMLRSALQVFSLSVYYADFCDSINAAGFPLTEGIKIAYQIFGGVLYVVAPVLLISFVATFFRNLFTIVRIRCTFPSKPIYVFSELNEKSLTLAESCLDHYSDRKKKNGKESPEDDKRKPLIVFSDVYERQGEEAAEMVLNAKRYGALCLHQDILALASQHIKKKKKARFFIIGSQEEENIEQAMKLVEDYCECANISLFVLTESEESSLLISSYVYMKMKEPATKEPVTENSKIKMKVRFISSAQALVYTYLYDTENNKLYKNTRKIEENGTTEEVISIVLVGLGQHGMELLRALVWYGQIPGIHPVIHVFERDPLAEQKFISMCPELIGMNHKHIAGDSWYDIYFHHTEDGRGIDAETVAFDREIMKLPAISAAFVTMGKDAENIRVAVKLRRLFEQSLPGGTQPEITAIVFNSTMPDNKDKKNTEEDNKNKYSLYDFTGKDYDINIIGDIKHEWSYEVIISPDLEKKALDMHKNYKKSENENEAQTQCKKGRPDEEDNYIDFYNFDYNRKSSMSRAIRAKVREAIPMSGYRKKNNKEYLTEEEKLEIWRAEHIGWNAYMRGEGYQYAPDRNDILKFHPLMLPYNVLPESQKDKDDDFVNEKERSSPKSVERKDKPKQDVNEKEVEECAKPGYDKYHKEGIKKALEEGLGKDIVNDYAKAEYGWTKEMKAQITQQRKDGNYPTYYDIKPDSSPEQPDFYKPILAYVEMEKERKKLMENQGQKE